MEIRDTLLERWDGLGLVIEAADNEGAASADLVVIATPWDAAAATAQGVSRQLQGKVVISMANALAKVGNEFQPLVPPRGSVAASVQAAVPRSKVAAGFHHVPAKELGDLSEPVESDVLICSDHREATEATCEIVRKIPNMRPLDAGQLSNAAAHRGVRGRVAAAQRALQDPRRGEVHRHRRGVSRSTAESAALGVAGGAPGAGCRVAR